MTKFEEEITLEISPVVDIDNVLELRYNLSALVSGIRDSDYFSVIIDAENEALVEISDDKLLITHSDGRSINQYNFSSIDEAFAFLQDADQEQVAGQEDDWYDEELPVKQQALMNLIDSGLKFLDEVVLTDEELDELERIQSSLESFLSSIEATYSCADDLEEEYYDPLEDTQ